LPSPLGQDFHRISSAADIDELRSKLELASFAGKKVLLYQGTLDERRGISQIVKLFADSCKNEDVILLLVGNGPARDSIKKIIRENHETNIILMDPIPYSKMPELIKICDAGLVLFPNHADWRYQTPTKLIEFLALEKPVIASDLAGIRWIAGNSPLVVYMKPLEQADVRDFQLAIKKVMVLGDNELSSRHSDFDQSLIDRFSSRSIASRLNQTINSMSKDQIMKRN
jgi:glycosyltransferase involved in cell wall biosynthesis